MYAQMEKSNKRSRVNTNSFTQPKSNMIKVCRFMDNQSRENILLHSRNINGEKVLQRELKIIDSKSKETPQTIWNDYNADTTKQSEWDRMKRDNDRHPKRYSAPQGRRPPDAQYLGLK